MSRVTNQPTNDEGSYPVRAVDGTIVQSPVPAVAEDGCVEIALGDRSDRRLNVSLTRDEGEAFWRINLPDHDGELNSTVDMQNRICRVVLRAASLGLLLNGGAVGRDEATS